MGNLPAILAKLGTIKNPVLFSSSVFSISTMHFSRDFVPVSVVAGALMFLIAAIVFLIAIWFYIYAFFKLPSSTQELVFLEEAKAAINRHKRSSAKPKAKKTQRNG